MFTQFKSANQSAQAVLALSSNATDRIAQLAKVYSGIKPLLTVLSTSFFVPAKWKSAIAVLVAALDAVTGEVSADFKAGKDL